MKATAILHIRNEEEIIRRCFDHLLENGINIAVIDNESDDTTDKIIDSYNVNEICLRERVPFDGTLNLPALLRKLQEVLPQLSADWIVYQGADEILQSIYPKEKLIEGIERLDAAGFSAINFNEFVFVPTSRWVGYENKDYVARMRYYYFFQPFYPRLMRIWKNKPFVSNFNSAGHRLIGENVNLANEDWVLRHYIVRSFRQARTKYSLRNHSQEGLSYGWHSNRINIDWSKIYLPRKRDLKFLKKETDHFDTSDPWNEHFWQRYRD